MGDSSANQELKTIIENAWHDLSSILTAVEVYTADLKEALPPLRESYQAAVSHNLLDNKQMDFDKIIDIAFSVGFGSISNFNKAFRQIMKRSPENFRKNNK